MGRGSFPPRPGFLWTPAPPGTRRDVALAAEAPQALRGRCEGRHARGCVCVCAAGCPQLRLMEMGFKWGLGSGCGAGDPLCRQLKPPKLLLSIRKASARLLPPARRSSAGACPAERAAPEPGRALLGHPGSPRDPLGRDPDRIEVRGPGWAARLGTGPAVGSGQRAAERPLVCNRIIFAISSSIQHVIYF